MARLTSAPPRRTRQRRALPQRVRRALQRTRARLRALLPNGELQSLTLYGSYVYGKPHIGSDIDLCLVYDDVTAEQENALQELATELLGERPRVHLWLYPADEVAKNNGLDPLLYNISHRGTLLEGVPAPKLEIDRQFVSTQLMAKAKEKLKFAQLLLQGDGYNDCISRSFYAVLYASDAALATKGFIAKSHEGTEMLFGRDFFKTRLVDSKFKGLFDRLHKARIEADYQYAVQFTREDAEYWFGRAQEFVAAVDASLAEWLAE